MTLSRTEARILKGLRARVPAAQARHIFRRGLRIAAFIDGGSRDQEILRHVCDLLAQEGPLVQELVEEIAARALAPRRPGASPAPPGKARRPAV